MMLLEARLDLIKGDYGRPWEHLLLELATTLLLLHLLILPDSLRKSQIEEAVCFVHLPIDTLVEVLYRHRGNRGLV